MPIVSVQLSDLIADDRTLSTSRSSVFVDLYYNLMCVSVCMRDTFGVHVHNINLMHTETMYINF